MIFYFFIIFGYNLATSGYIWLQWRRNDLKPVSSCFSSQSHSFWWVIWWNSMIFEFSSFSGRFGTVRPDSRKTGFFGKNRALSLSSLYQVITSCQKSETSHMPFFRKSHWYLTNRLTNNSSPELTSWRWELLTGAILWALVTWCHRSKTNVGKYENFCCWQTDWLTVLVS